MNSLRLLVELRNPTVFLGLLVLFAGFEGGPYCHAKSVAYHMVRKIQVPGKPGDSYWDNITVDPASRRIYVAHGSRVEVIHADTGKYLGAVVDTATAHSIAIVPELGKGFVTDGESNTVTVFDLGSLAHTAEIKVGSQPDAVKYDPVTHRIYVSNTKSDDIYSIDAATNKVLMTGKLGGPTENIVFDEKGTLWAILERTNELVTLDGATLKVRKKVELPGCDAPNGMAIDLASRRLFIGCRSRIFMVIDADKGNTITTFPIGEHIDMTIFDPETKLIFTSTGDGNITIVHEDSPNKYRQVQTVTTMRGAKTMALDSKTKKLFLPTVEGVPSQYSGPPDPEDAPYTPGPFVIVVVDKAKGGK